LEVLRWTQRAIPHVTVTKPMKPILPRSRLNRRTLLSILTALPALPSISLRAAAQAQAGDPLPSWNDGATKQAILNFVAAVAREGSPDYVPPPQRIATFDNDGTLWVEHPMYTQMAFALDRVNAMAPLHPEWKDMQPLKAVLDGDMKTLAETGDRGLAELVMATHAGMTTDEFQKIVTDWFASARDPKFKRAYTELAYQPMIELLEYDLRYRRYSRRRLRSEPPLQYWDRSRCHRRRRRLHLL